MRRSIGRAGGKCGDVHGPDRTFSGPSRGASQPPQNGHSFIAQHFHRSDDGSADFVVICPGRKFGLRMQIRWSELMPILFGVAENFTGAVIHDLPHSSKPFRSFAAPDFEDFRSRDRAVLFVSSLLSRWLLGLTVG